MNLVSQNLPITMSSEELAELLQLRHDNVRQAIRNLESQGVVTFTESSVKGSGRPKQVMHLDKRNSMVVAAKLNDKLLAAVVDRWIELEEKPAQKPMTTLEMIAGMASSMVEVERQQAQQAQALVNLSTEVAEIKESNMIWDKRPNNAEGITAIKRRINDKHGIPAWAIEEALRSAYGPRPAGSVRNSHESANGSTYVVYWMSDVTRMFERIAKEAEHVTATKAVHPMISNRFKLVA